MGVAIHDACGYARAMSAARIQELEQLLLVANAAVVKLSVEKAELVERLTDAELRAKKLKRGARKDQNSLKEQLLTAQNRRF